MIEMLQQVKEPGPEEAELLFRLARAPNGIDPNWILTEQQEGRVQLWHAGEGLVVTQLLKNDDEMELFVLGIVGRGILRALPKIAADLKVIAQAFGCSKIGGNSSLRPGFAKFYAALGAVPVYTYYAMEI